MTPVSPIAGLAILLAVLAHQGPARPEPASTVGSSAEAQAALRGYYARFENLTIEYQELWTPDSSSPLLRKVMDSRASSNAARLGKAMPKERAVIERIQKRDPASVKSRHRLVESWPSIKLESRVLYGTDGQHGDGEVIIKVLHGGKYNQIRPEQKSAEVSQSIKLDRFGRLPTSGLGLRIPFSSNRSLADLINSDYTRIAGEDELSGTQATVLQVGPGLPEAERPSRFEPAGWAKLWITSNSAPLPAKVEYHPDGRPPDPTVTDITKLAVVNTVTMSDFRDEIDEKNGKPIKFPREIAFSDAVGTTTWTILSVAINRKIDSNEFAAIFPDGYLVSKDGAIPTRVLAGGEAEQKRAISRTTAKAREMLHGLPVQGGTAWGNDDYAYYLAVASAAVLSVIVVVLIRKGVRNAA
jgi:hypothetical protein